MYFGEIAALLTAVFWTVTSMSFESAGKKVGSLSVNLIRLIIAFFIYGIVNYFRRGLFLPLDAGTESWLWLALSGLRSNWRANFDADYGFGATNNSFCKLDFTR